MDARDDAVGRKGVLYLASDRIEATGVRWVNGMIKINSLEVPS